MSRQKVFHFLAGLRPEFEVLKIQLLSSGDFFSIVGHASSDV